MIGAVAYLLRRRVGAGGELDVLGDVDDHRARAPVGGDVEGLVNDAGEIVDVLDQIVVLGAGAGDAHGVAFLKGIRADEGGGHLAGDDDDGDGIHQRIGHPGDGVGGAGAGGDERHAHAAGRAGIAFCGMHCALLMTHEHVLDLILLEELVINGQDRAAGIAENLLHALILQRLQNDLRPRHLCACDLLRHGLFILHVHHRRKLGKPHRQHPVSSSPSMRDGQQKRPRKRDLAART